MRKNYTMSDDQYDAILAACQPVPMIALQCGNPRTPQENANRAWEKLGSQMGFIWDTVQPNGTGPKNFSAEETNPGEQS